MKGAIILLYREILVEDGVHFVAIRYPLKPQSVLLRKKIPQSRYGGHLELCKKYIMGWSGEGGGRMQEYFILDQILFPSRQTSIVPLIFVKQCSIHIPQ